MKLMKKLAITVMTFSFLSFYNILAIKIFGDKKSKSTSEKGQNVPKVEKTTHFESMIEKAFIDKLLKDGKVIIENGEIHIIEKEGINNKEKQLIIDCLKNYHYAGFHEPHFKVFEDKESEEDGKYHYEHCKKQDLYENVYHLLNYGRKKKYQGKVITTRSDLYYDESLKTLDKDTYEKNPGYFHQELENSNYRADHKIESGTEYRLSQAIEQCTENKNAKLSLEYILYKKEDPALYTMNCATLGKAIARTFRSEKIKKKMLLNKDPNATMNSNQYAIDPNACRGRNYDSELCITDFVSFSSLYNGTSLSSYVNKNAETEFNKSFKRMKKTYKDVTGKKMINEEFIHDEYIDMPVKTIVFKKNLNC